MGVMKIDGASHHPKQYEDVEGGAVCALKCGDSRKHGVYRALQPYFLFRVQSAIFAIFPRYLPILPIQVFVAPSFIL